jgi:hypothetical protein
MTTADTVQFLQTGAIEMEGLLPWSSNYTFLVHICGEAEPVRAVYKPRRGERPLWDFPQGTLCQRERAAFLISSALDWDVVPPTVVRDGPHGIGSIQLFINHDPEQHYFSFEGEPLFRSQLQRIVLFDALINNADRKSGHVLLETNDDLDQPGKLWGIDHGICFHSEAKLRTVIWEFANEPIPDTLITALLRLQKQLQVPADPLYKQLQEALNALEIKALRQRTERLIRQSVFPKPGPGRHYPWPPV